MHLRLDTGAAIIAGVGTTLLMGAHADSLKNLGNKPGGIPVSSTMGANLISSAKRLPADIDLSTTPRELEANGGQDLSWLPNYAIKVLGCHQVYDWNMEADDEEDVRIMSKKLLRFRLCPVNSCGSSSAMGCGGFGSTSYGDYVVGMDVFLLNYIDYLQQENYNTCSKWAWNKCGCYDDGTKDDNFNQDQCEFQCWYKYEKSECYYDYTNDDDGYPNNFNLGNYMQCGEWIPPGYEGRRLDAEEAEEGDDGNDGYGYVDGVALKPYYIGPYCSAKGNSVFLGVFLDDTCSEFADQQGGTNVYSTLTGGTDMPYSIKNALVSSNCVSCAEQYGDDAVEGEGEGEDDAGAQGDAPMICTAAYKGAGKCETNLDVSYPNEAACNYIDGISLVEQYAERNKSSFAFVTQIFVNHPQTSMILLGGMFGAVVVYTLALKKKLQTQLFDENQKAQIAFNAAQMEAHYTDLKVKDAFLAM